jgi:hypothetical protein
MHNEFEWGRKMERGHKEELDIGGKIIMKWVLER